MFEIEQRIVRGIIVLDLAGNLTLKGDGDKLEKKVLDCCLESKRSENDPRGIILNLGTLKKATFGNYGEFFSIIGCYTRAANQGFSLKFLID